MMVFERITYNIILDGELYIHGMDFEDITSVVKNMNKLHNRLKDLNYCIFTFNTSENLNFLQRAQILQSATVNLELKNVIVLNSHLSSSKEEVLNYHEAYKSLGYEGTMIYNINALYTTNRTVSLLKYKDWIHEEGIVIAVKKGKGRERNLAILSVRDIRGITTDMRPAGKFEQRNIWYLQPETIIGQRVTFKYQNLTKKNIHRFATVLGVREII